MGGVQHGTRIYIDKTKPNQFILHGFVQVVFMGAQF